jgi:hypothetical protein
MAKPIIAYLATALVGHLLWETGQLPLYTLWHNGTGSEILWAVIHCTGGDGLIGAAALAIAMAAARLAGWPLFGMRMMTIAILVGVGYTVFSEWLNAEVRRSWAYAAGMPVIPGLGTGLSPMLQWLVIPAISFAIASRLYSKALPDSSRSKRHRLLQDAPAGLRRHRAPARAPDRHSDHSHPGVT